MDIILARHASSSVVNCKMRYIITIKEQKSKNKLYWMVHVLSMRMKRRIMGNYMHFWGICLWVQQSQTLSSASILVLYHPQNGIPDGRNNAQES